jgi:hypothetical protein
MPNPTVKTPKNQSLPAIGAPISVTKEEPKNKSTNASTVPISVEVSKDKSSDVTKNEGAKFSATIVESIASNLTEESESNSSLPIANSSLKGVAVSGEDSKDKSNSSSTNGSRNGSMLLASKVGSNLNLTAKSGSSPKLPIINSSIKGAHVTGRPKQKEIIKETIIPKTTSPTLKTYQKKVLPTVNPPVLIAPVANEIETIDVIQISTEKIDVIEPSAPVDIIQELVPIQVAPVVNKEIPVVPPRIMKGDGNVTFVYENYHESFPIVNGSTTHANIDDVYCLSFAMPDCLIHVSIHDPNQKRELEANGSIDVFCPEKPLGTYQHLEANCTYYVYVEQQREQLARDQERMKRVALGMIGALTRDVIENKMGRDDDCAESCSCFFGNPCVNEYNCADWGNRAAVATANGWKGF